MTITFDKDNRPKPNLETSIFDKCLEGLAAAALISFVVFFVVYWGDLPAKVPMHFDGSGAVNRVANKNQLWLLFAIGIFQYLLLTFITKIPHKFNYLINITEKNAQEQYAIANRMIRVLKLSILVMFFGIFYAIVQISTGELTQMPAWFLPLILVVVLGIVVGFIGYSIVKAKSQ